MKILELRFKNLNSLSGEWFIDFTHPEYSSNGIFALTGPTGAGKSTILDAICLALYGATPRLGRITKSENEIISRQTGECYAEVLFESQAGRFRCHWGQHRARKKTDGELQNPRHEISEGIDQGKVIEHQLRRVAIVVEEKTGMDFDRFTRSMLLAQGEFDTFLKADVEQKSKILEQITGTQIYTEISRKVHERQRDEHEQLKLLQAETKGIVILKAEQENEVEKSLEHTQKQERELAGYTTEAGRAIAWLKSVEELKKELISLAESSERQQRVCEQFKPERERLNWAVKASALDGVYATLAAERKQLTADQAALNREQERLPELESAMKQHVDALNAAEQQTLKVKEALKVAAPLIQKVRVLDQKLGDQKKAIETAEQTCKQDAIKIDVEKQRKLKQQGERNEAANRLKRVQQYLATHAGDQWLVSGLAGVEAELGSLLSKQQVIADKINHEQNATAALKDAGDKLDACLSQHAIRKQQQAERLKALEEGKRVLAVLLADRLLREYRTEKETLLREMTFLNKIAELEDHRSRLEDDQPCPLCGAKDHPYAAGNVPVPDATESRIEKLSELIEKAEDQEALIKQLEIAEHETGKKLVESEKLEIAAANEKKNAEKSLVDLMLNLSADRTSFAELKSTVLSRLQPLGIEKIPDSNLSQLFTSLQQRLKNWQSQVNDSVLIEKQLAELDSMLKSADAVINTLSSTLENNYKLLYLLKKEHACRMDERQGFYGDKNPNIDEGLLNGAIANAELAEKEARRLHDQLLHKLNVTTANIASLMKRIEDKRVELEKLEIGFVSSLQAVSFRDEKHLLEARLTATERDALKTEAKELDDRQTGVKAKQQDRELRLESELNRQVTDKGFEQLEAELSECEETLKQCRDNIAALKHTLIENSAAKERIKEQRSLIDAQKKESVRWEKLHGLIGSADGKKYRNFAQGLTFELMVSHANQQLEKMNDRYLLIRDNKQPLELNVVDNYQAGEIRSTKNLSGGESFIVSLTLALGLSKMASRKVRVDSLFLDEGFGTLDEETLETALETLTSLQQDGKLIGVISHVSALKERIATQIQVKPQSGGKSIIIGAGCKAI